MKREGYLNTKYKKMRGQEKKWGKVAILLVGLLDLVGQARADVVAPPKEVYWAISGLMLAGLGVIVFVVALVVWLVIDSMKRKKKKNDK